LSLVDAYGFLAFRAHFCELSLEAACTKGLLFSERKCLMNCQMGVSWSPHDVSLSAQDDIAVCAFKVPHVPVLALCFRTFVCKDDLK
jgi:hypothetical protein